MNSTNNHNDIMEAYFAYEKVRRSGKYNMFTPEAIKASGLSDNMYFNILKNYTTLNKMYGDKIGDDDR